MCRSRDSLRPSPYGSICVSIINPPPLPQPGLPLLPRVSLWSLLPSSPGLCRKQMVFLSFMSWLDLALHPPRCERPYSVTIIKIGLPSTVFGVAETRFDAHRYHFPLEGPWKKHFPLLKSHFVICKNDDWGLGLYLSGYGPCLECVRPLGSVLRATNRERKGTMTKATFDENKNAMVQPWNKHGVHTLT